MSGFLPILRNEWRLFRRDPVAAFFGFVFAPGLLVILGLIPPFREPQPELGGLRTIDLYLPIMIAAALLSLATTTLPNAVAAYREKGVLRRLAATPFPPSRLLAAQLVLNLVIAVISVLTTVVIAHVAYDVPLPENPAAFLIALVLLIASLFGIGLLISALAPTGSIASGVGMLLYFPLLFLAGLWLPREAMPDVLRTVSDFSPVGPGVQALQDSVAGAWPALDGMLILAVYAAALIAVASKTFRWS